MAKVLPCINLDDTSIIKNVNFVVIGNVVLGREVRKTNVHKNVVRFL